MPIPATLEKLRTPVSEEDALNTLLGWLKDVGFNSTSWQIGSKQRNFVRFLGIVYSDLTTLVAAIANFGYNRLSSGDALTEFSKSHYDNTRTAAVKTVGNILLTNSGAVPHTVADSDLVVSYTESNGTERTYRNATGGTISAGGGTLTPSWTAETAGEAWNLPVNVALVLKTALSGVTATNPANAGSDTWITTLGVDAEADTKLQDRNETKWGTLGIETIRIGVRNVALKAAPAIYQVETDDNNPMGAGTLDVYVAGRTATAGATDVNTVKTALWARFFGGPGRVRVFAAPTVNLDLTGTIYFDAKYTSASVKGAVEDVALPDFLLTVPLGGFDFTPGPNHVVAKNDVEAAIKGTLVNGSIAVKTVVLTVPAADLAVASFSKVVKGTWSLAYVAVAS